MSETKLINSGGYMTIDHPDAFVDFESQESKLASWKKYFPTTEAVPCPACRGRGGHNLRIDAYGEGKHFKCFCGQCNGWAFVKAGSPDATCVHEGKEIPEKSRMCWHAYRCTKCGHEWAVDSSD